MSTNDHPSLPRLDRLPSDNNHTFELPSKRINDGDDLHFFQTSTAYRDLMTWLLQLNRSMFSTKDSKGNAHPCRLDSPPPFSQLVLNLRTLISDLEALMEQAPPDTGPRRFGNIAFRSWFQLVESDLDHLLEQLLGSILRKYDEQQSALKEEFKVYLLGGLGSPQRLDYGTGHELSFVAFLGCLWKLGAFEDGEERGIVVGVIQPYLQLIRRLVLTYTLEPAGSHGVWGLDDHSFVPYIFGSAQLGPTIDPTSAPPQPTPTEGSLFRAPSPSKVADKAAVEMYKDSNMYFSAIQFIYDVKKGPFWEHSPVLYDISGIKDGWGKINKGMLKMYAAEVLGKFPVVQHFPFGSLFKWERDPNATAPGHSVHALQQPRASGSENRAGINGSSQLATGGPATKAPWATASAGSSASMPAATGVPSTRAPWVKAGSTTPAAPASGTVGTAAHCAPSSRPSARVSGPETARTASPWSSKPGGMPPPARHDHGS